MSALSRYVLGIRSVSPDFKQWLAKPRTGYLQWAVGRTPIPYGNISVKWGVRSNRTFACLCRTVPPERLRCP
ncbi:alpha-L-rhamnosidase C-terminal domain-containing protein [Paraburkholderia sp. GAS42]|uniref:alpha-L-rhamnosidase C-terminal domain-containing protein n=1 Tax=Paraburkholderia sp. GAS42 TaxID=3035135 RepID=UPI003D1BCE42